MSYILACIDASRYAEPVCYSAAFAAKRTGLPVTLLHVVKSHTAFSASGDASGVISLGAKSNLLAKLSAFDESHSTIELEKGQIILSHAQDLLQKEGVIDVQIRQKRGALVDAVKELEDNAAIVIMGKRGEHWEDAKTHLGSNVERVARSVHKPLWLARTYPTPVRSLLIAYDGGQSIGQAIQYIARQPLFKDVTCHLFTYGEETQQVREGQKAARHLLESADRKVECHIREGVTLTSSIKNILAAYKIDIVIAGAYSHSRIHDLILGSTTKSIIRDIDAPIILFR